MSFRPKRFFSVGGFHVYYITSQSQDIHLPGSIVTVPGFCVQCIATEFGIVQLKGKSTEARAEALISIAHPRFRNDPMKQAREMKIWLDQVGDPVEYGFYPRVRERFSNSVEVTRSL